MPSPIGAAAPLLALAALALALDLAPSLPWQVGVLVAALFAGAAAVRLTQQWLVLRRLRLVADRIILRSGARSTTSALVAWRTLELTSPHHRRVVAGEAARLARELDAATLPGAVPLNRAAVRPYRSDLETLARVLAGSEQVSARGVLLAERLLTSPASPLYDAAAAGSLDGELRRVISALAA